MEYNALYQQLTDHLAEKIRRGEYQAGERLDSEREMARQYGINRLTVRKALKKLEEQGYVEARRGSGTFVTCLPKDGPRIEQGSQTTISLSMQLRQSGYDSSRQTLSLRTVEPDETLRERFPKSEKLFELVRLSYVNREPYALQAAYFPAELFWDADRYDFANGSLYEYMDTQGHMPGHVESILQVAQAEKRVAQLLKLPEGKRVFFVIYQGFDRTGLQVEYTYSYYLPRYTTFRYRIERAGEPETQP